MIPSMQQYFATSIALFAITMAHYTHGTTIPSSSYGTNIDANNDLLLDKSSNVSRSLRRKTITNVTDRTLQQQATSEIDKIRLINADTNLPLMDLTNGMVINIANQPTANFNIQTTLVTGRTVDVIVFGYNNINNFKSEKVAPYAFCGDGSPIGNYYKCMNLVVGQHTVSATPYVNGRAGITKAISFRIINTPQPQPTCNTPKFIDTSWNVFTPDYPIGTSEPMGLILGNDFVSFGGFINRFTATTDLTYARDITIPNSPWRRMDDIPLAPAFTHSAVARVGTTKVYMCGGYIGKHPGPHTAYCFMYDHEVPPRSGNQWTRIQNLPNGGYAGGGMIYDSDSNTLYFAGGGQRLNAGSVHPVDSNRAFKYSLNDPSTGWAEITQIPYAANHLSAVTQTYSGKERHYFLGGQFGEFEAQQNQPDIYELIPTTDTWVKRTSMPAGRGHTTASTRPVGCGFITAGGSVNSGSNKKLRTNTILYYDIPTDSWTYIGNLSVAVATPLVDIYNSEYMYYINERDTVRRRISV